MKEKDVLKEALLQAFSEIMVPHFADYNDAVTQEDVRTKLEQWIYDNRERLSLTGCEVFTDSTVNTPDVIDAFGFAAGVRVCENGVWRVFLLEMKLGGGVVLTDLPV